VVIVWTSFKIFAIGDVKLFRGRASTRPIFITLYNTSPMRGLGLPAARDRHGDSGGGGHHGAAVRPGGRANSACRSWTRGSARIGIADHRLLTIVGLAYLMNYSGLAYTLGLGVASVGAFFVLVSPFLGWVAVFLSGSDTSGNALFGNLQVVAANQLNLNPMLLAATNSSGGVMGKMISPQNIATGVSRRPNSKARKASSSPRPSSIRFC
jgi:lactate permease